MVWGDGLKIVGEVIQVPQVLGLARLMVAEGQGTFLKAHTRVCSSYAAGQVPQNRADWGPRGWTDSKGREGRGGRAQEEIRQLAGLSLEAKYYNFEQTGASGG